MEDRIWEDVPNQEAEDSGKVWEDVPESDVPTSEPDEYKENWGIKKTKGFDNLQNPVQLIKKDSIPANLIKWLTTPEETYRKRERIEKSEFIRSIPIVSQIGDRLDEIEWLSAKDGYTGDLEDEHNKLIDAYGTLYKKMENAYDNGELESGFSWDAFTDSIKDDPTGMLSEVVNTFMASPELLLTPLGWEAAASRVGLTAKSLGASEKVANIAKVTGGISGASALGGGIAAADEASRQLGEGGKVDQQKVMNAAKIGAVAAPILIGGFKAAKVGVKAGASGISAKNFNRQFKKSVQRVERKAQEYMAKGLANEEQAVKRAINNSFIPNKVRKAMSERQEWIRDVNLSEEAIDQKVIQIGKDANKIKTNMYSYLSTGKKVVSDLFGNLTTEVGLVHPGLRHAIKRLDMDTAISLKSALDVKDKFNKMYRGLSDGDKTKLNIALGNGNRAIVKDIMSRSASKNPDLADVQKLVTEYLDDVYNRTEIAGMGISKIDNYFPMEVRDYKEYARSMGYSRVYIDEVLSRTINKKFKLSGDDKVPSLVTMEQASKYLSKDEIGQALNRALKTPFRKPSGKTAHTKARVVNRYTEENIKFYRDPVESLANYMTAIEPKIQESMFFGGQKGNKLPHSSFISNSIGGMVKRLYDDGEIIADDIERLGNLLTARFVEGTRAPIKLIADTKNILYTAVLANPLSAMTQMGDIGNSAYITSVMDTVSTVPKVIAGKVLYKMEDFGLNNIVQEFEHLGRTARILDKSLQWSGFKAIDRLGKETVLNASLKKYSRMAKSKKGSSKIIDKYKDAFTPEQMSKVIDDLKKGKTSPDIKYLLWHELTRVQPISLSEMPVSYLRNPNSRLFYMLKTFTLKQLDLVRREVYQQIRSGDVVGGMANLAKWTGILGLSNASVEQSKAWVRGEDVEFGDLFIAQMHRNYGLSQYVLKQMKQGRPSEAMVSLVLPPFRVVDNAVMDLVNFGERFESLKNVPPFGKGLYYLFDVGEE